MKNSLKRDNALAFYYLQCTSNTSDHEGSNPTNDKESDKEDLKGMPDRINDQIESHMFDKVIFEEERGYETFSQNV